MDYTVYGILQARILEWVAFSFVRGSSQPRDGTQVSLYQLSHQGSPTQNKPDGRDAEGRRGPRVELPLRLRAPLPRVSRALQSPPNTLGFSGGFITET